MSLVIAVASKFVALLQAAGQQLHKKAAVCLQDAVLLLSDCGEMTNAEIIILLAPSIRRVTAVIFHQVFFFFFLLPRLHAYAASQIIDLTGKGEEDTNVQRNAALF